MTTPRMLRLPDVIAVTGLGRDTIYKLEREGLFPRRRKLTPRATAWLESEVAQWIENRPVANRDTIDPAAPARESAKTRRRAAADSALTL